MTSYFYEAYIHFFVPSDCNKTETFGYSDCFYECFINTNIQGSINEHFAIIVTILRCIRYLVLLTFIRGVVIGIVIV